MQFIFLSVGGDIAQMLEPMLPSETLRSFFCDRKRERYLLFSHLIPLWFSSFLAHAPSNSP